MSRGSWRHELERQHLLADHAGEPANSVRCNLLPLKERREPTGSGWLKSTNLGWERSKARVLPHCLQIAEALTAAWELQSKANSGRSWAPGACGRGRARLEKQEKARSAASCRSWRERWSCRGLRDVMGGLCPHWHLRQKGEELTC